MMVTSHNFENNMEPIQGGADHNSVGDHVVKEGYAMGDNSIMDLLSANEKLVKQYTERLCSRFSGMLGSLPESLQESFIDSIRVMDGKNDVLYKGMIASYDGRQSIAPDAPVVG
jgi:hypothetical protein